MACLGYAADLLLFLGSICWLFNISPLKFLKKHKDIKKSVTMLVASKNLLGNLPSNISVVPETSSLQCSTNVESVEILKSYLKSRSLDSNQIIWDRVIGIGYSTLSVPVGEYSVTGFRPLYVICFPAQESATRLELKPVGHLDQLQDWLRADEQRNVEIFVAALLCLGFIFQILIRIFS